MSLGGQQGQAFPTLIGFIAIAGLLALLVAFIGPGTIGGLDPVAAFLLVTYPPLFGGLIYFYLQYHKISSGLREEYFYKWFLQSYAKVCLSESDIETIREELTSTILRLIRPSLVMLYELNPETNRLQLMRQGGMKNLPETAMRDYTFSEGIPGWVMQNQNIVTLPDILREPYLQTDPWTRAAGLRSFAAVPIVVRRQSAGIISMYSHEASFFQDANLLIAQLAAHLYALSLATHSRSTLNSQ